MSRRLHFFYDYIHIYFLDTRVFEYTGDEWRFNRSDVRSMFFISHMITKTLIFAAMERQSNSKTRRMGVGVVEPPHTFTVGYIAIVYIVFTSLCFPSLFLQENGASFRLLRTSG